MSAPTRVDLAAVATAFARSLRRVGLDVPPGAAEDFAEALTLVRVERPEQVFWAGRTCFCRGPEDLDPYAVTFWAFFRPEPTRILGGRLTTVNPVPMARRALATEPDTGEDASSDEGAPREASPAPMAYSASEVLRTKDFAACSDAELAEAERLMGQLRRRPPVRQGRRRRTSRVSGRGTLDVRATVRAALRSGGEPTRLARHVRGPRPRRVVLLLDVSGSMRPYARAMLRFAHATIVTHGSVEAFTLATRCTRVTRQLAWRDPDAALRRAASAAPDIDSGTRLGECLSEFIRAEGVGGLARGAVVVIVSDGWDRGDPATLSEAMARLSRLAHRIVWVNPLKVSPGYEPLARGMAAALPFTDEFLSGHSLAALEELAEVLAR